MVGGIYYSKISLSSIFKVTFQYKGFLGTFVKSIHY